jgi:hypothetical protein
MKGHSVVKSEGKIKKTTIIFQEKIEKDDYGFCILVLVFITRFD